MAAQQRNSSDSQAVGLPVLPPQLGATFAEVTYGGNRTVLVNTDCSIVHLLLHLRAKCIGEGFTIADRIHVEGSRLHGSNNRLRAHRLTEYDDDEETEYMDLLDKEAVPVELCNRDPMCVAKSHLKHRGEYVLCSVKKTKDGVIKEASPLLVKPPVELQRRINSVLRTMERFKTRLEKPSKAEVRRRVHTGRKTGSKS